MSQSEHADAGSALRSWWTTVQAADWKDFSEVRQTLKIEPRTITSEEQAEVYREAIDILTDRRPMSDGQREMVGLLGRLVYDWEAEHEEPIVATPQEVVVSLLEENGLPQSALVPDVFANCHNVSEFLAGRRGMSYERAVRLADFFHVSPSVFYSAH